MQTTTRSRKRQVNVLCSASLLRFGGLTGTAWSRIAFVVFCLTLAATVVPAASGATIYRMTGRLAEMDVIDDAFGSDAFGFDGESFQAVIELRDNTPDMVRAVDVIFRDVRASLTIGSEPLEVTQTEVRFNTDHSASEGPGGSLTLNTTRGEFSLRFDAATAVDYDTAFNATKPVVLPTSDIELTSASMWGLPNLVCIKAPCPSGPLSSYAVHDSLVTVVPEPNSCCLAGLAITAMLFQRPTRR